jgi:hypothetical protein
MRGHGLWWAAALVVATNLGAWGFAVANRSGEPEAVLQLTERELRLPAKDADNTALTLELVFERLQHGPVTGSGRPQHEDAGWFDRARLQAIGFDCRLPVTPENARHYRAQPPRTTFAALEFEGVEWQAQIQRAREKDPLLDTHLVAIDVDNDSAALRRRHPDRRSVAIVKATAALQFVSNPGQPPFLMGRVSGALPGEINVPREWRPPLERYQTAPAPGTWPPPLREPRYRVTVRWGSRFEPWIEDVQPLPDAGLK